MNPSFSEIKQLIENSSKEDGIKNGLKFSFYLFLFAINFAAFTWSSAYYKLFDHFTFLFKDFKKVGISEDHFRFGLIFVATFISYFILAWIRVQLLKDFLVKRKYKWEIENELNDFKFQGNIVVDKQEKAIHIIQSELGCIIKNRNWKNFDMKFEFKIPKVPTHSPEDEEKNQLRRGFGIIYRAGQLGKYYMLKVDKTGYLPHVRNIFWENNGKIFDTSITVNDLGNWIIAKLSMRDNYLFIKIGRDKFEFTIPTHSLVNKNYPKEAGQYDSEKLESLPFSKITFRNFGSVGFRSAPFEEVYIRNLEIKEETILGFLWRKLKKLYIIILRNVSGQFTKLLKRKV